MNELTCDGCSASRLASAGKNNPPRIHSREMNRSLQPNPSVSTDYNNGFAGEISILHWPGFSK